MVKSANLCLKPASKFFSKNLVCKLSVVFHKERSRVFAEGKSFLIVIENKTHAIVVIGNNIAYCIVCKAEHKSVLSEKVINGLSGEVLFFD